MCTWCGSKSRIVFVKPLNNSSTNGSCSPTCVMTNLRLHLMVIFKNVSHAMSCTPGWVSCINSNSLFTTVFKNFQCNLRNLGYWPTTYMMLLAMTALWSFPRMISHKFNKSRIAVTKNLFSWSSCMDPEILPIAQHNVFSVFHVYSRPFNWLLNFSNICCSVSLWSKCAK